jgi:hypothetical protein
LPPAEELPPAAGLLLGGRAAAPPPPRPRLARPSGASRLGPAVLRVAGAAPRSGGSRRAVRPWPHGHA